jgi:hypothetical protein
MSCLRDEDDLAGYLHMRLSLNSSFMAGLDELEPLIRWLDGGFRDENFPPAGSEALGVFRIAELHHGLALFHPRPSNRESWIETVYAASNHIDDDPLSGLRSSTPVDAAEALGRRSAHIVDRLKIWTVQIYGYKHVLAVQKPGGPLVIGPNALEEARFENGRNR